MQSLLEDSVFYNLLLNNQESLLDTSTEATPVPRPKHKADTSTKATRKASSSPSNKTLSTELRRASATSIDEDMQHQMAYPGQHMVFSMPHQHQLSHNGQHPQGSQSEMFTQQVPLYFPEHHTEPPPSFRNYEFLPQQQQQQQFHPHQIPQHMSNMKYPPQSSTRSSGDGSSYQPSVFSDSMSISAESMEGMHYQHQSQNPPSSAPQADEFFMKEVPHQIRSEIGHDPEIAQKRFHRYYTTSSTPLNNVSPSIRPTMPPSMAPNRDFSMVKKSVSNYHKCPFCQRSFKNKSYLSRHLKKHDTIKDFKCPFFNPKHTKCHHLNGEFSRKDTFKAHLKSIHFIYPIGVAKSDRNDSPGRCAGCFKEFDNNTDWLMDHIEKDDCPGFDKFKED